MSPDVSLERILSILETEGVPQEDVESIRDRHRFITQAENLGMNIDARRAYSKFFRKNLMLSIEQLDGVYRSVSQQAYITHIARVLGASIRHQPTPQSARELRQAIMLDNALVQHDTPEEILSRRIVAYQDEHGQPPDEATILSWRKEEVLDLMDHVLHLGNTIRDDYGLQERFFDGLFVGMGMLVDKMTRDRAREIDDVSHRRNYWKFARYVGSTTEFPRDVKNHPELAAIFSAGRTVQGRPFRSRVGQDTLAVAAKLFDRPDIIGKDIDVLPEHILFDLNRQLQGDSLTNDQVKNLRKKFREYLGNAALLVSDKLHGGAEELRRLSGEYEAVPRDDILARDVARAEFNEQAASNRERYRWAQAGLSEWGATLFSGRSRVRNLAKTFVFIDEGYKLLDRLADKKSYAARSLGSALEYATEVLDDALDLKLDRNIFFYGSISHENSKNRIGVQWDKNIPIKISRYFTEYKDTFGLRFDMDAPIEDVDPALLEIHTFSRTVYALMEADPDAERYAEEKPNQQLMVHIMNELMPFYRANAQKGENFFYLNREVA